MFQKHSPQKMSSLWIGFIHSLRKVPRIFETLLEGTTIEHFLKALIWTKELALNAILFHVIYRTYSCFNQLFPLEWPHVPLYLRCVAHLVAQPSARRMIMALMPYRLSLLQHYCVHALALQQSPASSWTAASGLRRGSITLFTPVVRHS
jgi:hypothetical protein